MASHGQRVSLNDSPNLVKKIRQQKKKKDNVYYKAKNKDPTYMPFRIKERRATKLNMSVGALNSMVVVRRGSRRHEDIGFSTMSQKPHLLLRVCVTCIGVYIVNL